MEALELGCGWFILVLLVAVPGGLLVGLGLYLIDEVEKWLERKWLERRYDR